MKFDDVGKRTELRGENPSLARVGHTLLVEKMQQKHLQADIWAARVNNSRVVLYRDIRYQARIPIRNKQ